MTTVALHTAKATLSQLLARVEADEETILWRGKHPVVQWVPENPPVARRRFGALRGVIGVSPELSEPLTDQELAAWE